MSKEKVVTAITKEDQETLRAWLSESKNEIPQVVVAALTHYFTMQAILSDSGVVV